MPVPAPVTRATFCDAAIVGPPQFTALSSLPLSSLPMRGSNAVLSNENSEEEPPMRRRDSLALSLAPLPMALSPAAAQSKYPERPIRLVVPFPPGGVYDAVGRPWAERMKTTLGTMIVENQGGAGGSLGAATVARARPDGYTLLLGGIGPLVINPVAGSRTPYDPLKDLESISILVVTAFSV